MPDISSGSGVRITHFMAKQANEPKHPENAPSRKKITGLIVVLVMLAVMASPVLLMSKDDAMKLPMNYRTTSSTEYAISQGADAKRCLWWVGDFSKVYEFTDYNDGVADTSLANAAYCMNDKGMMSVYQVDFSGKAVRPMVIVQF